MPQNPQEKSKKCQNPKPLREKTASKAWAVSSKSGRFLQRLGAGIFLTVLSETDPGEYCSAMDHNIRFPLNIRNKEQA
jgi:hypothetical protein